MPTRRQKLIRVKVGCDECCPVNADGQGKVILRHWHVLLVCKDAMLMLTVVMLAIGRNLEL